MRRLGFAIALLLLAASAWPVTSAARPAPTTKEGAAWDAWYKKYCAGRPFTRHPPYPTKKEWDENEQMTPWFSYPRMSKTIFVREGLYKTAGGKVTCLFRHEKVACTNGRHSVQCKDKACNGGGPWFRFDADVDALSYGDSLLHPDYPALHPKTFPQGVYLNHGNINCRTDGRTVRCHNGARPEDGAFTIDELFLSVESFFDGGDGWPWDGKCHSPFERAPGTG